MPSFLAIPMSTPSHVPTSSFTQSAVPLFAPFHRLYEYRPSTASALRGARWSGHPTKRSPASLHPRPFSCPYLRETPSLPRASWVVLQYSSRLQILRSRSCLRRYWVEGERSGPERSERVGVPPKKRKQSRWRCFLTFRRIIINSSNSKEALFFFSCDCSKSSISFQRASLQTPTNQPGT